MGSADETEIDAEYENAKEAIPLRNSSIDMGHPQPPNPMQVDNSTAVGFINKTIKQKSQKPLTYVLTGSKTENHKTIKNILETRKRRLTKTKSKPW